MLIITSDNSIEGRYEQLAMLKKTLEHYKNDSSIIQFKVMHGEHSEHDFAYDENGDSVFGRLIYEFITQRSAE